MDFESLAARYQGPGRLQRLLFIAQSSASDPELSRQAYELAIQEMKDTGNVHLYKELYSSCAAAAVAGIGSTIASPSGSGAVPGGVGGVGGLVVGGGGGSTSTTRTSPHPIPFAFDMAWLHGAEVSNRQARDVLQSRLQTAQSHLHKEAIRTAYLALAEHDTKVGDFVEAFHSVLRAKDYCTSRAQTAAVSIQILELSLHLHKYPTVREYVTKLEHTLMTTTTNTQPTAQDVTGVGGSAAGGISSQIPPEVILKVQTASALEALATNDLERAAFKFFSVATKQVVLGNSTPAGGASSSSGSNNPSSAGGGGSAAAAPLDWPTVLAPEEVALYTCLLTLALGTREEMVSLAEHPEALELLQPPALRETLTLLGSRNEYSKCWKLLQEHVFGGGGGNGGGSVTTSCKLDVHLAPHLPTLQQLLIQKCVLQYWKAYQRVPISAMTQELGLTTTSGSSASNARNNNINNDDTNDTDDVTSQQMIDLVLNLIRNGQVIDTRIDLKTQTLDREDSYESYGGGANDEDDDGFKANLRLAGLTSRVLDDTYSLLIRMACVEHDIMVLDPSSGSSKRGGGRYLAHFRGSHRSSSAPTLLSGGAGGGGGGYEIEAESSEEEDEDDIMEDTPMMDVGDGMNPEDLY